MTADEGLAVHAVAVILKACDPQEAGIPTKAKAIVAELIRLGLLEKDS